MPMAVQYYDNAMTIRKMYFNVKELHLLSQLKKAELIF